ncbi:MATE family efflux transporter [Marinicellulosiphila megalodicopiae]|uniref:MATE family efflux transporter n=1 Tax=Marinicellulosiphila megalodicopiae TaxID=2724896 RepID=UPI003BB2196F
MSKLKPTTESQVLKKGIWGMSLPMIIDQMIVLSVPLADTFFLSQISDNASAGVGAVMPLLFMSSMILISISVAGSAVAGQRMGGNKDLDARASIVTYAMLVFFVSFIIGAALWFFGDQFSELINLSDDIKQHTNVYLKYITFLAVILGFRSVYQTTLNLFGQPQYNTYANWIVSVFNIIGNAWVVFYTDYAVHGVAMMSIISSLLGLVLLMLVFHFKLNVELPFKYAMSQFKRLSKPILKIAVPSSLEPLSFDFYMVYLLWVVSQVGDIALTTRNYTYSTFMFCLAISFAFGTATQTMIAQLIGRKDYELAQQTLIKGARLAIIGSTTIAFVFFIFNSFILNLYTDNTEILKLGFTLFLLSVITEPGRATNIVVGGALRSAGDARFNSFSAIALTWVIGAPLAYILAITLNMGIYGIFIAALFDETIRAFIAVWRWSTKKWMTYTVDAQESGGNN